MPDASRPLTPAVILGGYPRPELADQVARGEHPRVDYLDFSSTYGASLRSFEGVPSRGLSPYWALALSMRAGRHQTALATGEDIGLPAALVQWLTGGRRPLSVIIHGSYLGSKKGAAVFRMLARVPWLRFLCLSDSLRGRLISSHGIPATRAVNVQYGVDTQFFAPRRTVPEPRLIVAAGMANRDYRCLVEAVGGLDASVNIAADSTWFRSGLDIDGLTLPPYVSVGSCGDYVGLRALYARSACVVVPLYDAVHACGYAVIAEAMAMGRPVIATRTASPSDYIVDGETGFLVDPGDVSALRARIEQILAQPDLAAWMGDNARSRMERHFSLESYNRRIGDAMGLRAGREWMDDCDATAPDTQRVA